MWQGPLILGSLPSSAKLFPQHPCQWPFSPCLTFQVKSLAPHRASILFLAESHCPKVSLNRILTLNLFLWCPCASQDTTPPPKKRRESGSTAKKFPHLKAGLHPATSSWVITWGPSPAPLFFICQMRIKLPPAPKPLPGMSERQRAGNCGTPSSHLGSSGFAFQPLPLSTHPGVGPGEPPPGRCHEAGAAAPAPSAPQGDAEGLRLQPGDPDAGRAPRPRGPAPRRPVRPRRLWWRRRPPARPARCPAAPGRSADPPAAAR